MTKEEEILKIAEDEFFTSGYDACSTAAIAKRAGVTHAMVNYYFRTKEKLFIQILDNYVNELLSSLKGLMRADGDVVCVAAEAAEAIFDTMNANRRLPYLLSDISRTHPDFLMRYKESFDTVCQNSIALHTQRLERSIAAGSTKACTMNDIYNTVLSLSIAPFLNLPLLENVAGFTPEKTEAYLQARKTEMVKVIFARYSAQTQV